MSGTGASGPDLLEGGGPERPGRLSADSTRLLPGGVRGFVERHRRATAWLAVGLALCGWLGLRWYDDRQPVAPTVVVSQDRSAPSVPLWSAGSDGRPVSAVTLSVATQLSAPDLRPGDPTVTAVGLAGPGLSSPGVFPHRALGRAPTEFDLTGQVACDQVTLPLPATAYQVQLAVASGPRTTQATVPLEAAEDAVSSRVTYGCSTWLAARDLTMTAVTATVAPERPHLDLTMTITNRGGRDGLVWLGDLSGTGVRIPPLQRVVPAHTAVTVTLPVDLDTCPSWSQVGRPLTAADTPIPLLDAVGVTRPLPSDAIPLSQGPNAVVLAPAVAQELESSMVQACAGVQSPVLLTEQRSTRYDTRTRMLTTTVVLDLPPGVVGSVKFLGVKDPGSGIVPLFTSSPWLVPDESGQAFWPVRFSVPTDVICLGGGPFVTMDALVRVPTADGTVRRAAFQLYGETLLPQHELDAACGRSPG